MAPVDPVYGMQELFESDSSTARINLVTGSFREESGKLLTLQSVKKVVQPNEMT